MSESTPETTPKVDKRKWDHLTPEQRAFRIARMQAGRKTSKPKQAPPAPVEDPRDKEIRELRARLDSVLGAIASQTKEAHDAGAEKSPEVTILPTRECYFEYPRGRREEGLGRIESPDDPAWNDLIQGQRRIVGGSFIVNRLIRAKSGEVISREQETGLQDTPNAARERMQRFFATGDHVIRVERDE